ncbi:MAG: V-type ATPase subunit [Synergistetes bacterium]|nr:V-type ATPase subunit [Synergistota bacterium]MCX8127993.1 V-type ATPase subunit [Synergistota bacterium]MDW8192812.1 V-type ATPase subunit [Synergistota bacterium]
MERNFKYTYAVSRIRYLENELLPLAFFHRLIGANSIADIKKILGETVYGLKEIESFDVLWEDEIRRTSNIVREILPDKRLKDFFAYSYDIFNIKILFKNKILSKRGMKKKWDILIDMGTVPIDKMISFIENEQYVYLPFYRKDSVYILMDLLDKMDKAELDTRFIDLYLDKLYFHFMLDNARSLNEPFLVEYVRVLIDLTNITTFFRSRLAGRSKSFLGDVLISGGFVDKDRLVEVYQDSLDSLTKALYYSSYGEVIEKMVSVFEHQKDISSIEKLRDDYLMEAMRRAKYVMFGIQPIVAFMVAKDTEIKNLRIVITGKQAGIPENVLKERLRNVYA